MGTGSGDRKRGEIRRAATNDNPGSEARPARDPGAGAGGGPDARVEAAARQLGRSLRQRRGTDTILGLIERIVLTPGETGGETHTVLHGNLGTNFEWAGRGSGKRATDTPHRRVSVSVVAGGLRAAKTQSESLPPAVKASIEANEIRRTTHETTEE